MAVERLYSTLPEEFLPNSSSQGSHLIQTFLRKELPSNEAKSFEKELNWQFLLNRHCSFNKQPKQIRRKKTYLTRKERKKLEILKLPKTGWEYDSLESMRQMWREYMHQNLELAEKNPECGDQDWANFSLILARSELIGSEIKVVMSKVPSLVGLTGTVVLETKLTFQIVTPQSALKIIPKETSVFEFILNNLRFTVFGKHIMTKPSERSVKKIKTQMLPDL